MCIPSEILFTLEQVKMSVNKKELWHVLGLFTFWRKMFQTCPYCLSPVWCNMERSIMGLDPPMHEEAPKLLIWRQRTSNSGAKASHRLPANWMGICNPLYTHTYVAVRTWRSHPSHWVLFFSFKDAKKSYSAWEKGPVCDLLNHARSKKSNLTTVDNFVRAF